MRISVWSVLAVFGVLGCSSSSVVEQAKLLGTQPFTPAAWSAAMQEQRGEMVYSFLSQHDAKSLSAGSIKSLLGNPTGYYDYDENPTYLVGPTSIKSPYGSGYLLAFISDKESGKIKDIKLVPEPKGR